MARPKKLSDDQRLKEAKYIQRRWEDYQRQNPTISQEKFMEQIEATQGLFSQWIKGRTPIPDEKLIWLGGILRFDPFELRPSLYKLMYGGLAKSGRADIMATLVKELIEADDETFSLLSSMFQAAFAKVEQAPTKTDTKA